MFRGGVVNGIINLHTHCHVLWKLVNERLILSSVASDITPFISIRMHRIVKFDWSVKLEDVLEAFLTFG